MYPHLPGGKVEKPFVRNTLSTPDRDSNLNLPVIGILVYCESSVSDHAATEFSREYFKYRNIQQLTLFTCSEQDSHVMSKYFSSMANIWVFSPGPELRTAALESVARQDFYRQAVFLDHRCSDGEKVLQENSKRQFLNASFYWVVWGETDSMLRAAPTLNMSIDAEFIWAAKDHDSGVITLYDIYKVIRQISVFVGDGTSEIIDRAGEWSQDGGLRNELTKYKYIRREDMRGFSLRCGITVRAANQSGLTVLIEVNNIPHENVQEALVKQENRELDAMATFNYGLFQMLQRQFNFTEYKGDSECDGDSEYEGVEAVATFKPNLRLLALSSASLKAILWDCGREVEKRGGASQLTKVSFHANKNRWITETVGNALKTSFENPHEMFYLFRMDLVLTDKFGFVVDEGNYDGLTELIGEGLVDLGISSLLLNKPRFQYVDYSTGYGWKFRICAIFRHPPVSGGQDALIKPFSGDLWLCTFLMWLLIASVLRILAWLQPKYADVTGEEEDDIASWSDLFLLVVGIVGEQGDSDRVEGNADTVAISSGAQAQV
uniref:Ionotropic receptor 75a N-terminal domain-containing protein n=1 Tax=Timema bartmani TaxID=61472 RepID=A0A7R9ESA7_9NEOP|nr:unnamed protein product [Timema bartmani]